MSAIQRTGKIGRREIVIPNQSDLRVRDFRHFMIESVEAMHESRAMPKAHGINDLELALLVPQNPDSLLAAYVWRNTPWATKLLRAPVLLVHAHTNVVVLEEGAQIPEGCVDARTLINGFSPPTDKWPENWTYALHIGENPIQELFAADGFLDVIPAKREEFKVLTPNNEGRVLMWVEERTFQDPDNRIDYMAAARNRGEKAASKTSNSPTLKGYNELVPVLLRLAETLTIPPGHRHAWEETDRIDLEGAVRRTLRYRGEQEQIRTVKGQNESNWNFLTLAVVIQETSLSERIRGKPEGTGLAVPGSADMTTDVFVLADQVYRAPLLYSVKMG